MPSAASDWAGRLTLAGAELAYLGVTVYLMWITWHASSGQPPHVSDGVVGVAGALAAAFGIGYASLLGVTPQQTRGEGTTPSWFDRTFTLNNLLGAGVFAYMIVGAALGITYIGNQSESPGVVKTIAVAFGGYVIAYIGQVYKNYRG